MRKYKTISQIHHNASMFISYETQVKLFSSVLKKNLGDPCQTLLKRVSLSCMNNYETRCLKELCDEKCILMVLYIPIDDPIVTIAFART